MKESFKVYIHPMSINSFYTGDRRYKSTAAREWTLEAFNQLNQPLILNKMRKLREHFDSLKHKFEIDLKAFYPKNIYKTKNGSISSKTIDTTNWEKSIVDLLFLPKFYNEFQNLNIDDKFLTKMTSEKLESEEDEYYIEIVLTINNLN